jgi:hypothetical protein
MLQKSLFVTRMPSKLFMKYLPCQDDLIKACTAVTANFPGLRDVEFHIRKESLSSGFQEPRADADPPPHILENITPTTKELTGHGGQGVKVFLHRQNGVDIETQRSW